MLGCLDQLVEMDKQTILAELRALADTPPDFRMYVPSGRVFLQWLAKAHALLLQHDRMAASAFLLAADFLPNSLMRESNVAVILNTLHRAIAALDVEVGAGPVGAFGPGAVYDFMRAFRELLSSATNSLLIVDPYLDATVFDAYVSAAGDAVAIRLLLRDRDGALKPALSAFVAQSKRAVEARHAAALHDRVVFVDERSAWVLGQSIKDAARTKATYLAPLTSDVASLKLKHYEYGSPRPYSEFDRSNPRWCRPRTAVTVCPTV